MDSNSDPVKQKQLIEQIKQLQAAYSNADPKFLSALSNLAGRKIDNPAASEGVQFTKAYPEWGNFSN